MPSDLKLFEVVRRAGNRAPGSWVGVVSVNDDALIGEVLSEVAAQLDHQARAIDVRAIEPFLLIQKLQLDGGEWVLLHGFDEWSPQDWHSAELNRNAWLREDGLNLFILGPTAVSHIGRYAPNVRSLIGPYIVLGPEDSQMSEAERQSRLNQLREHYGKTDAEVLVGAESQTLDMNPHMVEWLILLNRGDLV